MAPAITKYAKMDPRTLKLLAALIGTGGVATGYHAARKEDSDSSMQDYLDSMGKDAVMTGEDVRKTLQGMLNIKTAESKPSEIPVVETPPVSELDALINDLNENMDNPVTKQSAALINKIAGLNNLEVKVSILHKVAGSKRSLLRDPEFIRKLAGLGDSDARKLLATMTDPESIYRNDEVWDGIPGRPGEEESEYDQDFSEDDDIETLIEELRLQEVV